MVANVATASVQVRWQAVLCGGLLCRQDFVQQGHGPCIKLQPALSLKRVIWMTRGFVEQNGAAAQATVHRMNSFGDGRWKLAKSKAHFLERAAAQPAQAILLCGRDAGEPDWRPVRNKFTLSEAVTSLWKVSPGQCQVGACGG